MKTGLCFVTLFVLSGCATPNLVSMRGDKLDSSYSMQDRRPARSHITIPANLPIGVEIVGAGAFAVERCHQGAKNAAQTEAGLLDDLVLLAYAKGADGLTNVKYEMGSGTLQNCGHVAQGSATFYRSKK